MTENRSEELGVRRRPVYVNQTLRAFYRLLTATGASSLVANLVPYARDDGHTGLISEHLPASRSARFLARLVSGGPVSMVPGLALNQWVRGSCSPEPEPWTEDEIGSGESDESGSMVTAFLEPLIIKAFRVVRYPLSSGSRSPLVTNPSPTTTDYEPDVLPPPPARSR